MTKKNIPCRGRKKKNSLECGIHNKFCQDNLIRRFKFVFIQKLKDFINAQISDIYIGNIGHGIFSKKLLEIENTQFNNCSTLFNLALLNKTIADIFSYKINKKYTVYKLDHNIILINRLKNEKDKSKLEKINKLLNNTFLKCLEHLRGTQYYEGLEGLEKKYNEILNDLNKKGESEEYIEIFKDIIYNFEKYLYRKKNRKSKTIIINKQN